MTVTANISIVVDGYIAVSPIIKTNLPKIQAHIPSRRVKNNIPTYVMSKCSTLCTDVLPIIYYSMSLVPCSCEKVLPNGLGMDHTYGRTDRFFNESVGELPRYIKKNGQIVTETSTVGYGCHVIIGINIYADHHSHENGFNSD